MQVAMPFNHFTLKHILFIHFELLHMTDPPISLLERLGLKDCLFSVSHGSEELSVEGRTVVALNACLVNLTTLGISVTSLVILGMSQHGAV